MKKLKIDLNIHEFMHGCYLTPAFIIHLANLKRDNWVVDLISDNNKNFEFKMVNKNGQWIKYKESNNRFYYSEKNCPMVSYKIYDIIKKDFDTIDKLKEIKIKYDNETTIYANNNLKYFFLEPTSIFIYALLKYYYIFWYKMRDFFFITFPLYTEYGDVKVEYEMLIKFIEKYKEDKKMFNASFSFCDDTKEGTIDFLLYNDPEADVIPYHERRHLIYGHKYWGIRFSFFDIKYPKNIFKKIYKYVRRILWSK